MHRLNPYKSVETYSTVQQAGKQENGIPPKNSFIKRLFEYLVVLLLIAVMMGLLLILPSK